MVFKEGNELVGSNNHALIPDYFSTGAEHALKLGRQMKGEH